ncbi:unnamed protein product [Vitrella brassicaformis CCMP3155]|uniref:Peptidase A1 domain-containing protein n=2 Tax=Vitrella brassicaformis TaxID=1169539 RepID=A0A0G4GEZ7_VITBC|nr:unnamed protein product [Vitrella brassicaformis CCMP3155]|eukprot:CEM28083.1 unnamed protein product [Vitrella brassicaformis CCMP3155]
MWMWPAATAAAALLCAVLASCIFPQNDASRLVEHPVGHGAISPAVMSAKPKAAGKDGKDEHRHLSPVRQQLRNIENAVMVGSLAVGDPPQALNCVFDTGSFDLMVSSTICTSCSGSRYNSSCSRTYRPCDVGDTQSEALVKFGSGTMYAIKGFDRVVLPDSCPPPSSALLARQGQAKCKPMETDHHMPIWQIQDHTIGALEAANITAIAGMPWSRPDRDNILSKMGVDTVGFCIDRSLQTAARPLAVKQKTVVMAGELAVPTPSPALGLAETLAVETPPGYLTWNDDSHMKCPELFKQLPVEGKVHWATSMTRLFLRSPNGTKTDIACHQEDANGNHCGAVIDTGTSLLTGPESAVNHLLKELSLYAPNSDGIDEGCDSLDKYPDLCAKLGGKEICLGPEYYMGRFPAEVEEFDGLMGVLFPRKAKRRSTTVCVPAFISLDMDSSNMGKVYIMGLPLFCKFYTVFDRINKQIGLQEQESCVSCRQNQHTHGYASHHHASNEKGNTGATEHPEESSMKQPLTLTASHTDTDGGAEGPYSYRPPIKASKSPVVWFPFNSDNSNNDGNTGGTVGWRRPITVSQIDISAGEAQHHRKRVLGLSLKKRGQTAEQQTPGSSVVVTRGKSTTIIEGNPISSTIGSTSSFQGSSDTTTTANMSPEGGQKAYTFVSDVHIRLPLWAQDGLSDVTL